MPIRLPKLPERIPVKVTLSLNPELHQAVQDYAEMYRNTYGQSECEPVAEILPYMIQDYLDNDREFARARKRKSKQEGATENNASTSAAPSRRSA